MPTGNKQVFLTQSPTRWQRFKWSGRVLIFILFAMFVIIALALYSKFYFTPELPQLKGENEQFKAILYPDKNAFIKETKINKDYRGFRNYINEVIANGGKPSGVKKNGKISYVTAADSLHSFACPVRAAFYVGWDLQSYFSLKNDISKVNMILPEMIFIDGATDTAFVNIDDRGLNLIKASHVTTVAHLSNYDNKTNTFNGDAVHRIFHDPIKRSKFIDQVLSIVRLNKFSGVNIDFEELTEESDEYYINFMRELSSKFHKAGLIVSIDASPFNDDYNLKELSKYSDYIFLMAYDEYPDDGDPGPVCGQKWIEAAVDDAVKKVPTNKLILCLATYGWDWPKGGVAKERSYEEALSIASDEGAKVDFDNDSYNLNYKYTDDAGIEHTVYFTDAATNFNTMRFAVEYGLKGTALWRLGAEDSRIWSFYNKDMSLAALDGFDFSKMHDVQVSNDVDYIGEGEVLDVLSTPKDGYIKTELDSTEMLISEENYESMPTMFVIKKYGKKDNKMVLSFDDGPDPKYTRQILDILSHEHVPAVFFMIGINAEANIPLVKRIYKEGYEIGSHTFTHPNMAEVSHTRAVLELKATQLLIESITGHSTTLFRAPFNADSEPETLQELLPVAMSKKYNFLTVGESIDPNDWEPGINADSIFNRVVRQQDKGSIILLHDAGGNREATVQALPRIIRYFKDKGYTFTTVGDLIDEKKDQLMPPVPKNSGYYLIQLNYYIAEVGFWGGRIFYWLFIVCIGLSLFRILLMAFFATREYINEKNDDLRLIHEKPLVSIIVPAYNEEVNAIKTINNLLNSTYPNYNIIFVDDGSKDNTYDIVSAAFQYNPKVKVMTKFNGGKASALNFGIANTDAEYILCVDADTNLMPDALSQLMKHFANERVGAVAGNVKVGNEVNLITRWQSIEYITSQNFDRKAFANINSITVVPGAIGAFSKSAIQDAGGFTSDTFAEDCDLTMRILRAGYIVKNENKAIALTEAPETLRMFLKQRFRWSFGVMQSFWKNRDALFNSEYGTLGWIALPNILIFQVLIPLVAPLADLFMLIGLITGNAAEILQYYGIFMLVDVSVAIVAFLFERENLLKLLWIIPQRLVYRWLMLYVLFKSIRRAIKGELQSWGVLKRTGNVRENPRIA
jgi:cellulose synthase/poly-beta-1,6-N-acetylglucosamine synthase-like glycosyltransferase/spore germination protein YaaH/peptidoglycan/xylan/chitin deacetylase (PgdA/CDA1 family)